MISATTLTRLAAAMLLALFAGERLLATHKPPQIQAYHAAIQASAAQVPAHIGPWVGQDVPVLARAVKLLSPNIMISRRYTNVETGTIAGLLAVHCPDAHDMVGHYPPRCYPADGWNLQSSRPITWRWNGRTMPATEYTFTLPPASTTESMHTIVIENVLLRPGGMAVPDMDALSQSISGAQGQAAGAGQIQVYFMDTIPQPAEREAIFQQFLDGFHPVLAAVLADIPG